VYEPQLNVVSAATLAHYGVVADPARVRDPRWWRLDSCRCGDCGSDLQCKLSELRQDRRRLTCPMLLSAVVAQVRPATTQEIGMEHVSVPPDIFRFRACRSENL
jgi:hypothetical protein